MGISRRLGLRSGSGERHDSEGSVWGDGGEDVRVLGSDVPVDPGSGDGDGVAVSNSEKLSDASGVVERGFGLCVFVCGLHKISHPLLNKL